MGIYNIKTKVITIYDSKDIKKCVSNIEKGLYKYQFKIIDDQFDAATRIVFDIKERFVGVVSKI